MDPLTEALGFAVLYWLILVILSIIIFTLVGSLFTGVQAMAESQFFCWVGLHRYRKTDDIYVKRCKNCDKLKLPRGVDVS